MTVAIFSSRVVTPSGTTSAVIFVKGEKIVGIEPCDQSNFAEFVTKISPDVPIVDVTDMVISPGIIDAHVHVNEPGRTEWEGFTTATRAAAAGGVTSLCDMPLNCSPVTTNLTALKAKQMLSPTGYQIDCGFYGGLIPGNEADLGSLIANGVFGVKAFLCDSGLDEFPASDEATLRAALPILKQYQMPLLVHAELVSSVDCDSWDKDVKSYRSYVASRPPEFELAAIDLLIRLCREFETPIHIVHLAAAKALPLIRTAKSEGLPLTVETCPHYLFFDDTDIDDGQTQFKCAPPIRDVANRMLLCDAVADGTIDTIGSDHSPCSPEMKMLEQGDFTRAWGGISGLQLSLPATWSVGRRLDWNPELLADKLSTQPAEIFGFPNTGSIEVGRNADLVVWNPAESFTVEGKSLYHRHDVTPYEGRRLDGVVRQTWLRGQKIFDADESEKFGGTRYGRLVFRSSSNAKSANSIAAHLNSMCRTDCNATLESCCASQAWIERMIEGGNFVDDDDVLERAALSWENLDESDYLEAFSAHPLIGDISSLRDRYANTKDIAGSEQDGVKTATREVLLRLADANKQYFKKFGFIFIVFASGKSAEEMLQILESRLTNDRETEIVNAAAAQLEITNLRLQKLPGR